MILKDEFIHLLIGDEIYHLGNIMGNDKIVWISKAKGFAILGVLSVHTCQRFEISHFSSVAYAGQYCVQLFFIISAFLAFKSLEKGEITNLKTYFKYLLHKITRFMPILYSACLWHLIMYCIKIQGIPNIRDSVWRNGFFAVTFLNGFSYNYINPWYNWYIGDLVIFLALAPLIKKMIDTSKKSVLLFIISFLIGYTSTFVLSKCGIDTGWYFYFWFPRQFPSLAIGIVFYYLQTEKDVQSKINSIQTFAFIVSFCFLLSKCYRGVLQNHIQFGLLLLIFSYTLFNRKTRMFDWLKILGDNSYGVYLFHGCLLPIVSKAIIKCGFNNVNCCFIFCYTIVLLLSLCCSMIIVKFLERPFLYFLKQNFDI